MTLPGCWTEIATSTSTSSTSGLLLAAGSLLVGGLGATLAASLLVYSPTKLLKKLRNGRRAVLVPELQLHEQDDQLLARILAVTGVVGSVLFVHAAAPGILGWAGFGLATLLTIGVLPGLLAEHRAETVLSRTAWLLRTLRLILGYPLLVPVRAVRKGILKLLRVPETPTTDREEIADDIMAAVTDSATSNALEREETEWIGNIVELKDLQVSEAMTPRTDVVGLERSTPLKDAITICLETGHSRYPVFEEKIDDIVGLFYAKDALRLGRSSNGGDGPLVTEDTEVGAMIRKPLFVPESMGVVELLQQFKSTKLQMAVVLDEYGGTAGLITIEDIIEEIVGDISDEYDLEEEEPVVVVEEGRVLEISARARVEELNDRLGTLLDEDGDYDTIAGYVFSKVGRIPDVGESFVFDGVEFRILSGDDRRIGRLRVAALEHHEIGDE